MSIAEQIKNMQFFQDFVEKKESGNLSNATLFFCEDEITSQAVLTLAALLMEYPTFDLMNEKSGEYIRIQSGVDLDVKVYPKTDKILVADANEIVAEAYVRPVNLPYKIFLLQNFDNATEEAQNKLLKILEEPPQNVYFFISAKSEEKVLPTIKSRCEKIKILPLQAEEISKICTDTLANILGDGYIGKTLMLAKKDELKSLVDFAVSLLTQMKNSKQVLAFSTKFLDYRSEMDIILQVVSLGIEDMIKIKCEGENLCRLKPYLTDLKNVEAEYSVRALCEIAWLLNSFREKLEFNANLTVAIDNLLLKILEVKYLCK